MIAKNIDNPCVTMAAFGAECVTCHTVGKYTKAARVATLDGRRKNLCLNHAAALCHMHNLFDFTMNPKGEK